MRITAARLFSILTVGSRYSKYVLQTAGFDGWSPLPLFNVVLNLTFCAAARFPNQNQTRHW